MSSKSGCDAPAQTLVDRSYVQTLLALTPQQLAKAIRNGDVPTPKRFGVTLRWRKSEIDALLA